MNSAWNRGITLGLALGLSLSVTLSVLFIVGWKSEYKTTDTEITVQTEIRAKRRTESRLQEGSAPPATNSSEEKDRAKNGSQKKEEEGSSKAESDNAVTQHVTGSWVSGKSTMKYVMNDDQGRVEVFGYDVMRGQRVFCGTGRLVGRRLTIPDFYSFLDSTRGTLKLDLSEDGKTLEGYFEGNDPTREARVIMVRLP